MPDPTVPDELAAAARDHLARLSRHAPPPHLEEDALRFALSRRRRLSLGALLGGGVVLVVATAATAVALAFHHGPATPSRPGGSLPAALCGHGARADPCARPTPTPRPTTGPVAYIQPFSMSFVDDRHGWVVGGACDAAGSCRPAVARTADGGTTWTQVAVPAVPAGSASPGGSTWAQEATIHFGSLADGWLFGPFLAETLDGGQSWRTVTLPTTERVTDVFEYRGAVWAITGCISGTPCATELWESASPGAAFRAAAAQPLSPGGGASGYTTAVVAGGRVVLYGGGNPGAGASYLAVTSDGVSWSRLRSPCPAGMSEVMGGSSTGAVLLVCSTLVGSGEAPKEAWLSADGGAHWLLRSRSTRLPAEVRAVGSIPETGYPNGLAMPTSVDAWMSMGREDLYETHDGGITWTPSAVPGQFLGNAGGAEQVVFADRLHGWALGPEGLYRTVDGRTWRSAYIVGPVPGYG